MAKNNKKNNSALLYLFLFLVVLGLGGWLAYQGIYLPGGQVVVVGNPVVKPATIDQSVVTGLADLKKCGGWPLTGVSLSAGRGNPFVLRQNLATPAFIGCLPSLAQ